MTDTLTPEARSRRMSLVRGKDTKPELKIRRLVHGMGFRYRLHGAGLPGRPDLVFRGRRKVIFVHGCFWHRHGDPSCRLSRLPKSRRDFWEPKLDSNRERDQRVLGTLTANDWRSLVIWECECARTDELRTKIKTFLEGVRESDARN